MEDALHEVNEILERKDITDKHKAMIFGEHAKRFYNFQCERFCLPGRANRGLWPSPLSDSCANVQETACREELSLGCRSTCRATL
jgi:hypothetical protein